MCFEQGEVEQIALMKPKAQHPHETGMLEYLEDIIGTTRYKVSSYLRELIILFHLAKFTLKDHRPSTFKNDPQNVN